RAGHRRWQLVIEDEARLAGLPPSARGMLRATAEAQGVDGWLLTLQAPVVTAVLTYLHDADLREQVWRAYQHRCSGGETDNAPVIARMLALRREQAALLGFADFADYVLAQRMAKEGRAALGFLEDVERRCRDAFERETRELEDFARQEGATDALRPWDVS